MVDINFIRDHAIEIKQAVADKKINLDVDRLLEVDQNRRSLTGEIEELRRQRNEAAQRRNIEAGKEIKEQLEKKESELEPVLSEYQKLMIMVPTIPSKDTPIGKSDADNLVIKEWGKKPEFGFTPKDHVQLSKDLNILDLERGVKVAGYRGYYVKNQGVLLQMAIMMYALNKMVKAGYAPIIPPTLVKQFALFGSGYFKGQEYNPEVDEIYKVANNDDPQNADAKFLVGTAEPSLLAYYSGETLDGKNLPMKLSGFSQCYRSEIGSYGKDNKGIFRVHEFMKVEQVVLAPADRELAEKLQEEMVALSEQMHQELGLPYRKVFICTGDLSAGKYRQYDLEAWMPGLDRYGETGSASIFLDWQSQRLNVKYTDENGQKKYVYMLNNTALATARTIIAILENHQQADGSIKIPEVLQPYTGFSEIK